VLHRQEHDGEFQGTAGTTDALLIRAGEGTFQGAGGSLSTLLTRTNKEKSQLPITEVEAIFRSRWEKCDPDYLWALKHFPDQNELK